MIYQSISLQQQMESSFLEWMKPLNEEFPLNFICLTLYECMYSVTGKQLGCIEIFELHSVYILNIMSI